MNERFASAVLDEIDRRKAVVLVQDYQLALVPRLVKRARPDLAVSLFWHIPWPNPEELVEAILINPYATEEFAAAIRQAVDMPAAERRNRMRRLRQHVADRNVYVWARDLISHTARGRNEFRTSPEKLLAAQSASPSRGQGST